MVLVVGGREKGDRRTVPSLEVERKPTPSGSSARLRTGPVVDGCVECVGWMEGWQEPKSHTHTQRTGKERKRAPLLRFLWEEEVYPCAGAAPCRLCRRATIGSWRPPPARPPPAPWRRWPPPPSASPGRSRRSRAPPACKRTPRPPRPTPWPSRPRSRRAGGGGRHHRPRRPPARRGR